MTRVPRFGPPKNRVAHEKAPKPTDSELLLSAWLAFEKARPEAAVDCERRNGGQSFRRVREARDSRRRKLTSEAAAASTYVMAAARSTFLASSDSS